MKTIVRSVSPLILLVLLGAIPACSGDDDQTTGASGSSGAGGGGSGGGGGADSGGETRITGSTGDWVIYADAYGDAGKDNPITAVTGSADAYSVAGGKTRIKLSVKGLPPSKPFGAHLHKLGCSDTKAV